VTSVTSAGPASTGGVVPASTGVVPASTRGVVPASVGAVVSVALGQAVKSKRAKIAEVSFILFSLFWPF